MNLTHALGGSSLAIVAALTGPAAALDIMERQVAIPVTILRADDLNLRSGDLLDGAYLGIGLSGFSAGIVETEATAGIRLKLNEATPFSFNLQGSFGVHSPGAVPETWWDMKFNYDVTNGIDAHLLTGIGVISGTPVYRLGVGSEIAVTPNLGIVVEAVGRGPIGSGFSEFGFGGGFHFYPQLRDNSSIGLGLSTEHDIYIGGSASFVPSAGAFIPAVDFGVNCYPAADLEVGLRGSFGMQLPANVPEVWGGVQVGLRTDMGLTPYMFADLGSIGGFEANRYGMGLAVTVPNMTGLKIVAEGFGRGGLGTITEFGAKIGAHWSLPDIFSNPPPPPPPP